MIDLFCVFPSIIALVILVENSTRRERERERERERKGSSARRATIIRRFQSRKRKNRYSRVP